MVPLRPSKHTNTHTRAHKHVVAWKLGELTDGRPKSPFRRSFGWRLTVNAAAANSLDFSDGEVEWSGGGGARGASERASRVYYTRARAFGAGWAQPRRHPWRRRGSRTTDRCGRVRVRGCNVLCLIENTPSIEEVVPSTIQDDSTTQKSNCETIKRHKNKKQASNRAQIYKGQSPFIAWRRTNVFTWERFSTFLPSFLPSRLLQQCIEAAMSRERGVALADSRGILTDRSRGGEGGASPQWFRHSLGSIELFIDAKTFKR